MSNTPEIIKLSPTDNLVKDLILKICWYYKDTLDQDKLKESWRETLNHFPILKGRFTNNVHAVKLVNIEPPYESATRDGAMEEVCADVLPGKNNEKRGVYTYDKPIADQFFPTVEAAEMPLDDETPLLHVKVTTMKPGTAIALCFQHVIADVEAATIFLRAWSRIYRGLDLGEFAPNHLRSYDLEGATYTEEEAAGFQFYLPTDYPNMKKKYGPVFEHLMGTEDAILPLPQKELDEMKAEINKTLPKGQYVSTDDVMTARTWKGVIKSRCGIFNIPLDSEMRTTMIRAVNTRRRLSLPPNVFASATMAFWDHLTIKEVNTMSVKELAIMVRNTVNSWTPAKMKRFLKWSSDQNAKGTTIQLKLDLDHLLTFVTTSWKFPTVSWEDADFNAKPIFFAPALVDPIFQIFTVRRDNDGQNVWTSTKTDHLKIGYDGFN